MDFPVKSLPPRMRDAVEAQAALGNYPLSSVGTVALCVAALAAQGQSNVMFPPIGKAIPLSLYAVVLAASGGAKSTLFELQLVGPRRWQRKHAEYYRAQIATYEVEKRLWDRTRQKLEKDGARDELVDHEKMQPLRPRSPFNISSKMTTNGLIRALDEEWPSHGLFSPEGASLLKSYSLSSKNAPEEFGGTIASLWSGESIDRATGDVRIMLHDRRLSMLLMVQGPVANEFLSHEGLEAQGALARFLVVDAPAWRPLDLDFTAPDHMDRAERLRARMEKFHERIESMLDEPLLTRDFHDGELELPTLGWSAPALSALRTFQTESFRWQIEQDGESFFNRTLEHCVRIAGVLSVFEGETEISEECAVAAVELIRFYAHQRRSLDVSPHNDRHSQWNPYIQAALKKFRTAPDGITMRDLSRSIWKKVDYDKREKIISAMIADEFIEERTVKKGTRSVTTYHLKEEEK